MSTRPRTARRRWLLVGLVVVLAVALELAIRAGEPRTVGPSGVDTLQVPWRDPEPDDFVEGVDHPWLPLEPGARWSFDGHDLVVGSEPYEVAGVDATVVELDGATWFVAEDVDGNVWLLGQRGGKAGAATTGWSIADGSPAGLVLPAVPRRGDGWATVVPRGEVQVTTRVDQLAGGQGSSLEDARLVLTLTTLPDAGTGGGGSETVVRLARGEGPVQVLTPTGEVLTRSG